MVCVGIQGKGSRLLRTGIYLFTIMEWISAVGFSMFPLSDSGYAGTFQDKMHIFSTVLVVMLSIVSLPLIGQGVYTRINQIGGKGIENDRKQL